MRIDELTVELPGEYMTNWHHSAKLWNGDVEPNYRTQGLFKMIAAICGTILQVPIESIDGWFPLSIY